MKVSLTLLTTIVCAGQLFAQAPEPELKPGQPRSAPPPHGFQPPGPPHDPLVVTATAIAENGKFKARIANGISNTPDGPRMFMMDDNASRTLLIGAEKMKPATADVVREDLNIMSRILDKSVEKALNSTSHERRMGISVMALPGARSENIFIKDYGAIFVLNAPIPLTPTAKSREKQNENADSDWEQAKRELYGNRFFNIAVEPMKYDEAKVDALKKDLISALKNASNIHEINANDTVTIVVTGSDNAAGPLGFGAGGTGNVIVKRMTKRVENGKEEVEEKIENSGSPAPRPRPTTLTLRAKKSDIDAFAKGKQSLEEFSNQVTVSTY